MWGCFGFRTVVLKFLNLCCMGIWGNMCAIGCLISYFVGVTSRCVYCWSDFGICDSHMIHFLLHKFFS